MMSFLSRLTLMLPMLMLTGSLLLTGCGQASPASPSSQPSSDDNHSPGAADVSTQDTPARAGVRIIFLGDSLTAGYGLEVDQAFPALIQGKLVQAGLPVSVVNAGVSGDTTAGGLRRLDWLLKQKPDIVVVALGGNDGLRGLDLSASEANLRQIIQQCHAAKAKVLLAGMLMPPNYGPDYTQQFRELYPRLAKETGATLLPFLLEGVAGDPALNLPDGIHPNAPGQAIVAEHLLPVLLPMVQALDQPSLDPRP